MPGEKTWRKERRGEMTDRDIKTVRFQREEARDRR